MRHRRALRVLFVFVLSTVSCARHAPELGSGVNAGMSAGGGREVSSNLLRSDYAGSKACAGCHSAEYGAWLKSPMHRMTRDLRTSEIHAPFEGARFELRGDSATMKRDAAERFVEVRSARDGDTLYRVTKVIGGRYREDFVGAAVAPGAPLGLLLEPERVLPISYLIGSGEWRYKGYSVMVRERPGLERGVVWKQTCIYCHNTLPQLSLLYDDLYGEGAPSYQGSASVALPAEKRFRYLVTEPAGLKKALGAELSSFGLAVDLSQQTQKDALETAIGATFRQFDERNLIELGVGCEMCHGGSREHVERPTQVRPSFALHSDFLTVKSPRGSEPTHAEDINRACAQCHTVLFSRYPYTWEGSERKRDPGGSSINSGEARDFLLGACTSQLSCVACHDPHAEEPKLKLAELEGPAGDAICTSCHGEFGSAVAARSHTHHAPDSPGSRCINCHMPRKNMGLAYELTRYHRIGSPTDAERVEGDRPLECALCHADKSVAQIVETLERFWGKHYDRARLARLYGNDLGVNALEATLVSGKPHEQATAIVVLSQTQRADLVPLLARRLDNDYPLVRLFARHAIERSTSETLPIDLNAPASDVRAAAEHWLSARAARAPGTAPP